MGLLDFVKNNLPGGNDSDASGAGGYDPNSGMSSSTMPVNPADPNAFASGNAMDPNAGAMNPGMTTGQMGGVQPVQGGGVNPVNDIQASQMQQMQSGLFNPGADGTNQVNDPNQMGGYNANDQQNPVMDQSSGMQNQYQPQPTNQYGASSQPDPNTALGVTDSYQNQANPMGQQANTPDPNYSQNQGASQNYMSSNYGEPAPTPSTDPAQMGVANQQDNTNFTYPLGSQASMPSSGAQPATDNTEFTQAQDTEVPTIQSISNEQSGVVPQVQNDASQLFNQVDQKFTTDTTSQTVDLNAQQAEADVSATPEPQQVMIDTEPSQQPDPAAMVQTEPEVEMVDDSEPLSSDEDTAVQVPPANAASDEPVETGVQDVVNVADSVSNQQELPTNDAVAVQNTEDTSTAEAANIQAPDFSNFDFSSLAKPATDTMQSETETPTQLAEEQPQSSLTDQMLETEVEQPAEPEPEVKETTNEEPATAVTQDTDAKNEEKPQTDTDSGVAVTPFESIPKKDLVFSKIAFLGLANSDDSLDTDLIKRFGSAGVTLIFDGLGSVSGSLLKDSGINPKQIQIPFVDAASSTPRDFDDLGEITTIVYSNIFDYYRHIVKEGRAFVFTSLSSLETIQMLLLLASIQLSYGANAKPILVVGEAAKTLETNKAVWGIEDVQIHVASSIEQLMEHLSTLNAAAGSNALDSLPRKVDRRVPGDERDFLLF